MRHLRPFALWLGLLALLVSTTVGAQENVQQRAGIYVDFGNGEETWAVVPLVEDSISSIELLERTKIPVLTVGFGGLGDAVCMIETTGCDLSACRRTLCQEGQPDAPFWQFLEQDGEGNWVTSPLGASSASVGNGSINAWVWTGTTPDIPMLTIDDLIVKTGYSGADPALATTLEATGSADDSDTTLIVAGSMLLVTVVVGGGLVYVRRTHHAAR